LALCKIDSGWIESYLRGFLITYDDTNAVAQQSMMCCHFPTPLVLDAGPPAGAAHGVLQ
jgi:hypothetical protein